MKHVVLNREFGVVRTVAVFGPGRGGTSVIAGCVRALGVCMGAMPHPYKHEWSPIVRRPDDKVDLAATRQIIEQMNTDYEWWGWKFPSDVFHIETVTAFLRDPGFIVVTRDLTEIALSSLARQDVPFELSLYEAAKVSRCIAERMLFWPWPILVIPFAEALQEPNALVEVLRAFLQINPDEAMQKQACEFVQPSTRGYRPFDAKPDQLHDFSSAREILTDSQNLAIDLSRRYAKDYFQQFQHLLSQTKAMADRVAAKIENADDLQIAFEMLKELQHLFGLCGLTQVTIDGCEGRTAERLSRKQWREVVIKTLDGLACIAQKANDGAMHCAGDYDQLNHLHRALQLVIRARTTLKAGVHRLGLKHM